MTLQLRALIGLRWSMVRSIRARRGFLALAGLLPLLCLVACAAALLAPSSSRDDVLLLTPTAYLSVAVLALVAPLVVGGGNELFPAEQLAAFPISARTQFAASIVLAPLNLAWTTQVIGLVGLTTYDVADQGAAPLAVVTCLAYVACVTVLGQGLAWLVVGVRQHETGRRASWVVAGAVALAAVAVVAAGNATGLLDRSPTTYVVIGALNGATGGWLSWLVVTGALLATTVAALALGERACSWSARQPGGAKAHPAQRPVRRRSPSRGPLRERLAVDRASVWRSTSLRRGLLVLALLPGLVAAAAGLEWPHLVMLPGLVAAGAGLLFGVNAFCLDATGTVWLASLPAWWKVTFQAKAIVVMEVCLVAAVLTVAAGSVRAGRPPHAAEVAAVIGCLAATISHVVARCMLWSVNQPHRADLRGPRDTPAPPGAMAAYSIQLSVSTTLLAVGFSLAAEASDWRLPAALAVPVLLFSSRRLVAAAEMWRNVQIRARVVGIVAHG